MKKEQILLIVCVLAAVVIAYSNVGLYEAVGARDIPEGKDVESSLNVSYDPQTGLPADFGQQQRSLIKQRRVEVRPELPTLAAPKPLPPIWVKLLPWPAPDPEHWATLRERIAIVAAAPPDDTGGMDDPNDADDPDAGNAGDDEDDPFATKPSRDPDQVARLLKKDGKEILCDLIFDEGPTWEILARWPNVSFKVRELNPRTLVAVGTYPVGPEDIENTYATVHLEKTCEKEFHERRIRQRVRDDDRGALMELARWVMDELAPRYGQEAVRTAIETAEKAVAIKADLASVRELAALYRAAFDLNGELKLLQEFLQAGNTNDPAVLELVAECLDRARARGPARAHWKRAAEIGSLTARLGLAENLYASGDLDAALEEFRKVQGSGDVADQAHAYEGEARVLIRRGRFQEALTAADRGAQASMTSPRVLITQGAARYYVGRYADAEKAFRAAVNLSKPTETRALSNLGMALVAQGKLDEAEAAFRTCIEKDPLNYFDPIVGLGDVLQRKGRLTEANDYFETALVRDPHDPWILLRLGTSKLADGVSDRALELARELITAAPGCVDGLRLAGLAVHYLDPPDHEEALRHLSRALRKEPENVDLLRRYAAALLFAGRKEQALSVLEEATATGTGFARRDGRTLLLHAYTLFLNRQPIELVREVIAKALRADIDEEATEYGKAMLAEITEWDALRIWTDEFRRARAKLFGGWKEEDQHLDVSVSTVVSPDGEEDYAMFKGFAKAAAENRNATAVYRAENAKQIREWEAGVRMVSTDTQFVMHVYSGSLQDPGDDSKRRGRGGAEIAFVVGRDGKMKIWTTAGTGRTQNLTEIPIQDADGNDVAFPMDGQFHTIRMERTDHQLGKWQIYLDGEAIGDEQEIGQLAAQRNTDLTLGFQVDADRGTQIEVHVDRVQILRTVD